MDFQEQMRIASERHQLAFQKREQAAAAQAVAAEEKKAVAAQAAAEEKEKEKKEKEKAAAAEKKNRKEFIDQYIVKMLNQSKKDMIDLKVLTEMAFDAYEVHKHNLETRKLIEHQEEEYKQWEEIDRAKFMSGGH
jgi:hypothetical protein